jgi:hypothetical protein
VLVLEGIIVELAEIQSVEVVAITLQYSRRWASKNQPVFARLVIQKCNSIRSNLSKLIDVLSDLIPLISRLILRVSILKIHCFSLTPLATKSEFRHGVISMHLQERQGKLVTVGYDRVIMTWDISKML